MAGRDGLVLPGVTVGDTALLGSVVPVALSTSDGLSEDQGPPTELDQVLEVSQFVGHHIVTVSKPSSLRPLGLQQTNTGEEPAVVNPGVVLLVHHRLLQAGEDGGALGEDGLVLEPVLHHLPGNISQDAVPVYQPPHQAVWLAVDLESGLTVPASSLPADNNDPQGASFPPSLVGPARG